VTWHIEIWGVVDMRGSLVFDLLRLRLRGFFLLCHCQLSQFGFRFLAVVLGIPLLGVR